MKTLIVFATKYGFTKKCVEILAQKLSGEIELVNLNHQKKIDLAKYEKVIIGGPIRVGTIQKQVAGFCKENFRILQEKKLGLFICGMHVEKAIEELNNAYATELLAHAVAKEFFGGEFSFKKGSFLDKMMVKKVAKIETDINNIQESNIDRFVQLMNES